MFKKVLLAVDLNEPGSWKRALPAAIEACGSPPAKLHVITVMPEIERAISHYFPLGANEKMLEKAANDLAKFVERHVPAKLKGKAIVSQGSIYRGILDAAKDVNADLIVMASHKPGITDYLLGANAAHVVRHFRRSVLVVRG